MYKKFRSEKKVSALDTPLDTKKPPNTMIIVHFRSPKHIATQIKTFEHLSKKKIFDLFQPSDTASSIYFTSISEVSDHF